ncbi:hypothetical protein D0469_03205 [Peribacillus saganii]|uniref:Uncharacterized protein n=1 Tax=Peribacillus saganii TaxID=2303992 RepID=A0A372LS04_9BACI|nr:hypothetical protein D0469_03205 [Peribacillus saganii]
MIKTNQLQNNLEKQRPSKEKRLSSPLPHKAAALFLAMYRAEAVLVLWRRRNSYRDKNPANAGFFV